eukprot:7441145-Karenia_brevis.AAC.1
MPCPGAAHIAMSVVNIPYLTLLSDRICICATPGRGAQRNDSGKQTLPDSTFCKNLHLRRARARRT